MRKVIKTLLALALFMGTIALVLGIFILSTDRRVASVDEVIAKVVPKSLRDDPLFYRTIGSQKSPDGKAPAPFDPESRVKTYTVEVQVTTRKDRAKELVQKLQENGFRSFYTAYTNPNGRVFYKVRTGIFKDENTANIHAKNLKKNNFKGIKVRSL